MILPLSQSDRKALSDSGVWSEEAPVSLERLVKLSIRFLDFEGVEHQNGEMIVLDAVAPHLEKVFAALFERQFPIAKIQCISAYGADDLASMAENNSSAFNCRRIQGSDRFSIHSYGTAIDINPLQNPILLMNEEQGRVTVQPQSGWKYINRANQKPGMVEEQVELFAENGFLIWGGCWTTPIDYHHFQTSRAVAELLAALPSQAAISLYSFLVENHSVNQRLSQVQSIDTDSLVALFEHSESKFYSQLAEVQ